MRVIIYILLAVLMGGYFLNHYVITDPDNQWYCYFVVNDLKALLISLALLVVTWKTKDSLFAISAVVICLYDVITQVLNANVKGGWSDLIYNILLALIITMLAWKMKTK
jgi:hypothetical protein